MTTQADNETASAPETRTVPADRPTAIKINQPYVESGKPELPETHAQCFRFDCAEHGQDNQRLAIAVFGKAAFKNLKPAKPSSEHVEQQLKEHIDALKWTRDNEKLLAWQRDQARNHAEKLAAALRDAADWLGRSTRIDDREQASDARAALAAWERGQE